MKKGCLLLLALWVFGSIAEYYAFNSLGLERPWYISILLALAITLFFANIAGVFQGIKYLKSLRIPPIERKDGMFVGITGRLQPVKAPIKAPISGEASVLYEYNIKRIVSTTNSSSNSKQSNSVSDFTGFGMVPCVVQARGENLRLIGFPLLAHFREVYPDDQQLLDRVAAHFDLSSWTAQAKSIKGILQQYSQVLSDEDGDLKIDFCSDKASISLLSKNRKQEKTEAVDKEQVADLDQELLEENQTPLDYYKKELQETNYQFSEQGVKPGTEVSAFGTFKANPPRLDIGSAFRNISHALYPGTGTKVVRKIMLSSLFMMIFFGAINLVGHFFAYVPEGKRATFLQDMMKKISPEKKPS